MSKYTLLSTSNKDYGYAFYGPEGELIATWDEKKNSYLYVYKQCWLRVRNEPGFTIVEDSHVAPLPPSLAQKESKTIRTPKAKPETVVLKADGVTKA